MEWLQDKVNPRGRGKTSTDSGAATRTPLAPGLDPTGAAAQGQSAELIDADIAAGFAQGVAGAKQATRAQREADESRVAAQINATLRQAGVPPVQVIFEPRPAGKRGVFVARTWGLHINRAHFHDPRERVKMLGTVYHEARHAEQYFDAMRVAARVYPGKSVAGLARWFARRGAHVPPTAIIDAARRQSVASGDGDKWFNFYFGEKAETHRTTRAWSNVMVRRGRELNAARRRHHDLRAQMRRDGQPMHPRRVQAFDEHYKQEWAKVYAAFEAYDRLADEEDADDAKNEVIKALGGTP